MSTALIYAFLFFIGSLLGWCIELLFRHWFSISNPEHRWVNPGFCIGPYLPLYGFGLCILYFMSSLIQNSEMTGWKEYLIALILIAIEMTVLEYIAGIFLLKVADVRLWDYSQQWGNINGLVCPLFTVFWTVLGVAYYILVHPYILNALAWLSQNLAFSFFIGVFYGVFAIDVAVSINFVAKVKKFADENGIVVKYEELKEQHLARKAARQEKLQLFKSLPPRAILNEALEAYKSKMESVEEGLKAFEDEIRTLR